MAAHRLARRRRAGRDAGPRPGRLAPGRRVVREGGGVGARQAARRRQSPRRPHRVDLARTRADPAAGGRAGRLGRAHQPVPGRRPKATTSCSAARATTRRARPTTRWRSCCRWAIRAGRSSIGWRREGNDDRDSLARHAADQSRSQRARARRPVRFQLQRPQDRGAAARARSARRRSASNSCRTAEIVDLAASFQRRVVETLIDRDVRRGALARREIDRHRRRRVGEFAPARARRSRRRERSEIPVYIPRLSLSTDNAAMIAAAGMRQLAPGEFAPADLNAAASLPL